uniref:Uncharacterized protein n=1 Tax=Panagrolaimus sp. PS1159 TaxID=55785 RepID=A0AC35EZX2_9BILA
MPCCNKTFMSTLASMNHSKKLSKFVLTEVHGNIDITKYILKNASDDCYFFVDFNDAEDTYEVRSSKIC